MSVLLPDVLNVRREGDAKVALDLHVPASLIHFNGHFPGLPILPGVVQIDWAVRMARAHLSIVGEFATMENIKFHAFLVPDTGLELDLVWDAEKGRLEFVYSGGQRKYSSGRIVFSKGEDA